MNQEKKWYLDLISGCSRSGRLWPSFRLLVSAIQGMHSGEFNYLSGSEVRVDFLHSPTLTPPH